MDAPSILLIHTGPELERAFQELGCATLTVQPDPGSQVLDLAEHIRRTDFAPGLIVQRENLHSRLLVSGLERFQCPKIFWGLDSHLNAHWHAAYARLFDITCATQKKWICEYKKLGAEDVRWLPWHAPPPHCPPWNGRRHGFAFVGRFSEQRPARRWMCERLAKRFAHADPAVRNDVSYDGMLQLYGTARIVPNESIFNESNLRLFEAASRGCVVLNPDIGPELAELFEPGREIEIYDSVVDLEELLARHLADGQRARVMGHAAFERVRTEHLAEHRARTLLDYAADATSCAARGREARTWMLVTEARLMEYGYMDAGDSSVRAVRLAEELGAESQNAVAVTAAIRLLALAGSLEAALHMLRILHTLLVNNLHCDDTDLNLTACMAWLWLGMGGGGAGVPRTGMDPDDAARAFLLRQMRADRLRCAAPEPGRESLLLSWARLLHRSGRTVRAGLPFAPGKHLPGAATECLLLLLSMHPEHVEALRLMESLTRSVRGTELARVGYLSLLTLHDPDDWRMGLELSIADMRSYRRTAGEEELRNARNAARDQGQEKHFFRALSMRDPSGLLRGLLEGENKNQR